jgi:hypothetical protein
VKYTMVQHVQSASRSPMPPRSSASTMASATRGVAGSAAWVPATPHPDWSGVRSALIRPDGHVAWAANR